MTRSCYRALALAGALCLAVLGCRSEAGSASASNAASTAGRSETLESIYGIVAEQMVVDRSKLTPATTLAELDMDELDYVETVMSIEERFGITLSDAEVKAEMLLDDADESFRGITLADLANRVDGARGARTP